MAPKPASITRMEAKMAQRSTAAAGPRKTKMNFISPRLASLLFYIICSHARKTSRNGLASARMSDVRARSDVRPSYEPPLAPHIENKKKEK